MDGSAAGVVYGEDIGGLRGEAAAGEAGVKNGRVLADGFDIVHVGAPMAGIAVWGVMQYVRREGKGVLNCESGWGKVGGMVEIEDIVDAQSLGLWLGDRSPTVWKQISYRISMRNSPDYLNFASSQKEDFLEEILQVFRTDLTCQLVSFYEFAIGTVSLKRFENNSDVVEGNTAFANSIINRGDLEQLDAIQKDCRAILDGVPLDRIGLWHGELNEFVGLWGRTKWFLEREPNDWSFWIRWFDAALAGEPWNYKLLEQIALIPDNDWTQGPAHVNGMIAAIEAEFVANALPQADKMDVDPDTGLVEITPILTTEEAIVATSLKQVEFSYSVAKNSNCGLNFNSVACLYLEQAFENCRDDPNAIFQNYQIALDDILDGLKNGAYLDDAKLTALSAVLEKEIVNILANHPAVKKADRARIAHALSLAKSDVKLKIVEELEFAKAAVGLRLDAEMSLDSKLVAEEAESPAQAKAAQRLFGRIAQMYVTMKNASVAVVKKIDAATGYKFARIVMTLGKIVGWIASLFT